MARILVLYGTSDGHTEKVATAIGNTLIDAGCDADVIRAGTIDPAVSQYDGVIVAASIHGGRYQGAVIDCVRRHAGEIAARPNAFVNVCLAVLQKNDPKVAADLDVIVNRFARESGWTPALVKPVAGALLYTRYNLVMRWIMKRIVAKAGGDTDTSRDYVYTDWEDVKTFARDFSRRLTAAAA